MPDTMTDMFKNDAGAVDAGLKAAGQLDKMQNDNTQAASPTVTMKARTFSALLGALNGVMAMFGAPKVEADVVDLKDGELPVPVIRALMMVNKAYSDYIGENAINLDSMTNDKEALVEIAKLINVGKDKAFKKFLMSPPKNETKATEAVEETGGPEEEKPGMSEEDMMKRMG